MVVQLLTSDPRIQRAIQVLAGPQRQDSLEDQLSDVLALAVAAGCYDAVEVISRSVGA